MARPKWQGGCRPKKKTLTTFDTAVQVNYPGVGRKTYACPENATRIANRLSRGYGVVAACDASGVPHMCHYRYMREAKRDDAPEHLVEYARIIKEGLDKRVEKSITVVMESEDPKVHLDLLSRLNPEDYAPAAQKIRIGQDLSNLDDEGLVAQLVDAVSTLPDEHEEKRRLYEELKACYEPQRALPEGAARDS